MFTRTLEIGDDIDLDALPAHLADRLRTVKADKVTVDGDRVAFTGGGFRWVTNWNALAPFGFGSLAVDRASHSIQYRLSLRQLAIGVMLQTIVAMTFLVYMSRSYYVLMAIPVAWGMLIGLNLAIGIPRFESFLRRAVRKAPRVA